MPSVLISGASVAGPALAWWLARAGFAPVLVERSPGPRLGGQAIDIRGVALEVMRRMGLLGAAFDLRTQLKGLINLDGDGREISHSEEMTLSGGSFANDDFEILRDDLSAILIGALPQGIEIIHGDSVTHLAEDGSGVSVTFETAPPRRFDLVVGADGIHSNIRGLTFGDERQFLEPIGVALAVYSAPNHLELEDWQIVCREGGATCIVSPVRNNRELRLCYSFPASLDEEHYGDIPAQMALLADKCGHLHWEVPRLLEAMWQSPDFYLGAIAQVKLPRWTKGRVTLVGDAAYCPSPASGQGTSLALVGAFVLGQELARSPDDASAALAAYEARMRPFVEANHALVEVLRADDVGGDDLPGRLDRALDQAKNAIALDTI